MPKTPKNSSSKSAKMLSRQKRSKDIAKETLEKNSERKYSVMSQLNPVDHHLSAKLREFRIAYGISQEELGEISGVTFQQIQKYETAINRIPASRLFEFSQLLKRPFSDFFADLKADRMYYHYEFASEETLKNGSKKLEKDVKAILSAFSRIENSRAKRHLIALAEVMATPKHRKIKHCYS